MSTRHVLRLAAGLLLLAASGPVAADAAPGRGDESRSDYRARADYDGPERGPARAVVPNHRPLGTSYDGYRNRFGDHSPYRGGGDYSRQREPDRDGHDARSAAESVRRNQRGRVLSSEPIDDRGYRVRVLTPDGYVRERFVDPHDEHYENDDYDDQRQRSGRRRWRD